ncbi:hypothetical protein BGZ47_008391 [Haplosporangium gracile]|nr:hypothetical protein BGZ47_008391 [Haplosporangium gracile]
MKFDKIFSLSWFVIATFLLISIGPASNNMVLAVPAPGPVANPGSVRVRGQYPTGFSKRPIPTSTETVCIAIPTKGPFRFRRPLINLPVESPVLYKRQDGDGFKTVPKSHETDPVEKNKELERAPLSKRRMMNDASIRWINPSHFQKRVLPSTNTPEKESESESVNGSDLSKRREMSNSWIHWIRSGGFNV